MALHDVSNSLLRKLLGTPTTAKNIEAGKFKHQKSSLHAGAKQQEARKESEASL
jgi:hypothetical protein